MEIVHIVLKVIREAMLSLAFLGTGTIAAGFLFRESEMMKALLLLGLAVAGGGCYQPISYADPVHRGVIGAAGGAWPVDPTIAVETYFLPQGISGLARGFLRFTYRLAPNAMSTGITLGKTGGQINERCRAELVGEGIYTRSTVKRVIAPAADQGVGLREP